MNWLTKIRCAIDILRGRLPGALAMFRARDIAISVHSGHDNACQVIFFFDDRRDCGNAYRAVERLYEMNRVQCDLAARPIATQPRGPKTCLDDTGLKITGALYKAVSAYTGDMCLLAMIRSWGDTLDDDDILDGLNRHNEMGECFIPNVSAKPQL